MIIYKVTNLINNKIYIGKTTQGLKVRKSGHWTATRFQRYKSAFHDALCKYGEENFMWEIIDKVMFAESLIALEKHYIELFNCKAPNGYNLTDGGDGTTGFKHSEKTRKKMSQSMMGKNVGTKSWHYGKPKPEETKRKMSMAALGKKRSIDSNNKNRMAHLGKHPSAETRKKMSAKAFIGWEKRRSRNA